VDILDMRASVTEITRDFVDLAQPNL
jgi:hypothetical protein